MTMREKMAEAMMTEINKPRRENALGMFNPEMRASLVDAVLDALVDLTPEMEAAAHNAVEDGYTGINCYVAMIRAAKEGK